MAVNVKGFSFIEFTAPNINMFHQLFYQLGFVMTEERTSPTGKIRTYQQGNIVFVVTCDGQFANKFAFDHGPSVCGFGFDVWSERKAYENLIGNGAKGLSHVEDCYAIYGIGDAKIYLSKARPQSDNAGVGLTHIDHLTNNVYTGNLDKWADFYEKYFNLKEIRVFNIKGSKTGLKSRAMGNNSIAIPVNEDTDGTGQIAEYLKEYRGEGVQHIALSTDDIYATVEQLRENDIKFLDVPDTYYDMINDRIPRHREDIDHMRENKILIDGQGEREPGGLKILLQLFTDTYVGPVFFEIIQRKGNNSFGEGNFQALFDAMERDQIERGVL